MERLVILGGGESGVGTAILGKKKGYDAFVSDFGKIKNNYKEVLILNKIKFEDEQHSEELILNADVVMKNTVRLILTLIRSVSSMCSFHCISM